MESQWAITLNTVSCSRVVSESEVSQSCPTLCDPIDCSLPGSSVHGIFQARVLEWVAISFSRRSSWPRDRTQVSYIVGRRFTVWATSVRWGKCRGSLWGLRWSLQCSAVFLLLVYVCACMLNHVWLFVIPWTSPPGSFVHGIFQARILVWVAIAYSSKWCCESAALNMPANLENSAVAMGLEKVSFHSNPKEGQCQRRLKLSHNYTHLTR